MIGLLIVGGYLLILLQLQTYVWWLPWLLLLGIGGRYAFVVMRSGNMSKYRILTNFDDVLTALDDPQQAGDRLFTEDVLAALERIGEEHLFGQEHVLKPLIATLRANAEVPGRERPLVTAAFFGPPGVGKTTLAELINQAIFKSTQSFLRIDSNQYQDHDISSLFGAGKSYIGSDSYGAITRWLKEGRKGVLLIDEPDRVGGDKKRWIQAMMPLLEGRVTEVSTKQEFSTRHTAIFFASNYEHEKLGAIAMKYQAMQGAMEPRELAAAMRKEVMAVLDGSVFPKAFLDRLDLIAVFAPLSTKVMADIVLKEIALLTEKHAMEVEYIQPEIVKAAIRVGKAGESIGARDFKRWVTENVNPALVDARRQHAKKLKLMLTPEGRVCAAITESHDLPTASPRTKAKA